MTLKPYTILLVFIVAVACKEQRRVITNGHFQVETASLPIDTGITAVSHINGYLFCLLENHRIFVLDSGLNPAPVLTEKFSGLKIDALQPYNDTILLTTDKEIFFLDSTFNIRKYNRQPFKYNLPYYNDSIYYVYGCSAGEFGGAVFFWNWKTNKTYSYPAICVQQVFKYKDAYLVSNFLTHLGGFSDYLSIKDPTKLYEIKDEEQKTYCNWYTTVDSLKNIRSFDTPAPPGVKYYADNFTTRTLVAFPHAGAIYSIYCTDSATILARHQDFKLIPVDTLLRRRIIFHRASTHLAGSTSVTAYRANWYTTDSAGKEISFQNTGLIYIHDNVIKFLECKTPHMPVNR